MWVLYFEHFCWLCSITLYRWFFDFALHLEYPCVFIYRTDFCLSVDLLVLLSRSRTRFRNFTSTMVWKPSTRFSNFTKTITMGVNFTSAMLSKLSTKFNKFSNTMLWKPSTRFSNFTCTICYGDINSKHDSAGVWWHSFHGQRSRISQDLIPHLFWCFNKQAQSC